MSDNKLTSEALEKKINEISNRFNGISDVIKEKSDSIEKIRREIIELQDEQKRLQGEYRFIINLAKEYGLLSDETIEATGGGETEEESD